MNRVISWQIYSVALLAVAYFTMQTMEVGQVAAALLASAALGGSILLLFLLRVPVVQTALFTALVITLLTAFAVAASGSAAIAVTVAFVFAILVVGLAALFSLPLPQVRLRHALMSYSAQATVIITLISCWQV